MNCKLDVLLRPLCNGGRNVTMRSSEKNQGWRCLQLWLPASETGCTLGLLQNNVLRKLDRNSCGRVVLYNQYFLLI